MGVAVEEELVVLVGEDEDGVPVDVNDSDELVLAAVEVLLVFKSRYVSKERMRRQPQENANLQIQNLPARVLSCSYWQARLPRYHR